MSELAIKKGADVFVTAEIDHHEGIDSVAQGLAIIDAGHYGLEHIFVSDIARFLQEKTEGVKIVTADIEHPFQFV
jgi:putative NIF3 family GTP cyclohydrolase 1 type 2